MLKFIYALICCHETGDAQFVEDAILELRRSRHALMSSYIHGYYIKRHMEREMFEELQVGSCHGNIIMCIIL